MFRNPLKPVLELKSSVGRYLTRWTPVYSKTSDNEPGWIARHIGNLYLHRMEGPDPDRCPHNHPFRAVCLVLRGGYRQTVHARVPRSSRWSTRISWVSWFNVLRADEYHKITYVVPGTWTLCITGPVFRQWGFLMASGRHMHCRPYLNLKNGQRSDDPSARRNGGVN